MKKDVAGCSYVLAYLHPKILELVNPKYPRWEKRWSGVHWEEPEDCCCGECGGYVPDEDAVQYDVFVFEKPLPGILAKRRVQDYSVKMIHPKSVSMIYEVV